MTLDFALCGDTDSGLLGAGNGHNLGEELVKKIQEQFPDPEDQRCFCRLFTIGLVHQLTMAGIPTGVRWVSGQEYGKDVQKAANFRELKASRVS